MDLFDSDPDIGQMKHGEGQVDPLAYRMAPRSIDEYVGQEHIVGKGKLLRRAIEADRISSLILYGPPGTGKTALAKVIAAKTLSRFEWLNAATASLDDLRKIIQSARNRKAKGIRILTSVISPMFTSRLRANCSPMLSKKSFTLSGHRTSVALEAEFWAVLGQSAQEQGISLAALVARIDAAREGRPLASALRLYALAARP